MTRSIELFAGTAALSLCLLSGATPPTPYTYLGGKRRYARGIVRALGLRPGPRRDLLLVDKGEAGRVLEQIVRKATRDDVLRAVLRRRCDGRDLYDEVAAEPVPDDPIARAAAAAILQTGSVLGKPPVALAGRWKVAGYGAISPSARRRGFRDRLFRQGLAEKLATAGRWLESARSVEVRVCDAREVEVEDAEVVFVDLPYVGVTGYGAGGFLRSDVVDLALRHFERSQIVAVFEHEPIRDLVDLGWDSLTLGTKGDERERKSSREVMTFRRRT